MGKDEFKRLAKAKHGIKVGKDSINDYSPSKFRYRTAAAILEKAKPILDENELYLSITYDLICMTENIYVSAEVAIKDALSGQELEKTKAFAREQQSRKGFSDEQLTGSAETYALKYALSALFEIDDSIDVDSLGDEQKKQREYKCRYCGKEMKKNIYEAAVAKHTFAACSQPCADEIRKKLNKEK